MNWRERLLKLIDVKSIVTLLLVLTLVITVFRAGAGDERVFLLFSNCTSMIVTYFFTRKTGGDA